MVGSCFCRNAHSRGENGGNRKSQLLLEPDHTKGYHVSGEMSSAIVHLCDSKWGSSCFIWVIYVQDAQVLIAKPWFIDSKPRSTGGLWPLPGQRTSADITHGGHQERNVAIIPHRSLLPSQWLWGGVRLCLGGCWWVVHGLGETHTPPWYSAALAGTIRLSQKYDAAVFCWIS